jgi:hypothetical protein
MTLSDMDKGRIGVDYAKAFEHSIALMASMPSQTAGILDEESLQLERRAYMLLQERAAKRGTAAPAGRDLVKGVLNSASSDWAGRVG